MIKKLHWLCGVNVTAKPDFLYNVYQPITFTENKNEINQNARGLHFKNLEQISDRDFISLWSQGNNRT